MAIIGERKFNAVVSSKEWEFLRCPLLAEERKESPRWKLENVSGFGPDVYMELTIFGNFWKDLDDVISTYVPGWEKMEA